MAGLPDPLPPPLLPYRAIGDIFLPHSDNVSLHDLFTLQHWPWTLFWEKQSSDKGHWCVRLNEMAVMAEKVTSTSSLIFDIRSNDSTSFTFIVAPPGTGKSYFLRRLFSDALNDLQNSKIPFPTLNIPIYVSAKTIVEQQEKKESFLSAIAKAATEELVPLLETKKGKEVENVIHNYLKESSCLLLIDHLDFLGEACFYSFLDQCFTHFGDGFKGKILFSCSQIPVNVQKASGHVKTLIQAAQCFELIPGKAFKLPLGDASRKLFQSLPNSVIDIAPENQSLWVSFERLFYRIRQRLYPSTLQSPALNLILVWYLGSNPDEFSHYSISMGHKELHLSLHSLLEAFFSYSVRQGYKRLCKIVKERKSVDGFGASLLSVSRSSTSLLEHFDLDINQIKRLSSFVGYLIHWYHPTSLRTKEPDLLLPHIFLIEEQISHLLQVEEVAVLAGFNVDEDSNVLILSESQKKQLVQELFVVLSDFFTICHDDSVRAKHPAFREFLATRYLNEPAYFTSLLGENLQQSFSHPSFGIGDRTISFRPFQWNDAHFLTDYRWDSIYQFSALLSGVDVMLSHLLKDGESYKSSQNLFQSQQKRNLATSSSSVRKKKSQKVPVNRVARSISTGNARRTEMEFKSFLCQRWLTSLQTRGFDNEDFGQIRFLTILRAHSLICNHRSAEENMEDWHCAAFGTAFIQLMTKSATSLVHLEFYPNYFLNGFPESVSCQIIQKCISVLTRRPSQHIVDVISLFAHSSLLSHAIGQLGNLGNSKSNDLCKGLLTIFKNIDKHSPERESLAHVIKLSTRKSFVIGSSIFSSLLDLGYMTLHKLYPCVTQKVKKASKEKYFLLPQDPLRFLQSAVHQLTLLVESQEHNPGIPCDKSLSECFATISALLQQTDNGSRFLGFLCLFQEGLSPSICVQKVNNQPKMIKLGKEINKNLFLVCDGLVQCGGSLDIATSFSFDKNKEESLGNVVSYKKLQTERGRFEMTSLLNSVILHDGGPTASCWVSSSLAILLGNDNILIHLNSLLFLSLPTLKRRKFLQLFFTDDPSVSWEKQRLVLHIIYALPNLSVMTSETLWIISEFLKRALVDPRAGSEDDRAIVLTIYVKLIDVNSETISFEFIETLLHEHVNTFNQTLIFNLLTCLSIDPGSLVKQQEEVERAVNLYHQLLPRQEYVGHLIILLLRTISHAPSSIISKMRTRVKNPLDAKTLLLQRETTVRMEGLQLIVRHASVYQDDQPFFFSLLDGKRDEYARGTSVALLVSLIHSSDAGVAILDKLVRWLPRVDGSVIKGWSVTKGRNILRIISKSPPSLLSKMTQMQVLHFLSDSSQPSSTIMVIEMCQKYPEYLPASIRTGRERKMAAFFIMELLGHKNESIRNSAQNCLHTRSKELRALADFFLSFVDTLITSWMSCKEYYKQKAVISTMILYDRTQILQPDRLKILQTLLLSTAPGVARESIRYIKKYHCMNNNIYEGVKKSLHTILRKEVLRATEIIQRRKILIMIARNPISAKDSLETARILLTSPTEHFSIRCKALIVLSVEPISADLMPSIIELLETNDPINFDMILGTLETVGKSVVNLLPPLLTSTYKCGPEKWTFLSIIKDNQLYLDWLDQVPAFIKLCGDPDPIVILNAIDWLKYAALQHLSISSIQLSAVLETFTKLNGDPHSMVRKRAVTALGDVGKKFPKLVPAIMGQLFAKQENPCSNLLVWRLLSNKWNLLVENHTFDF